MMFNCDKCGICCRNLDKSPIYSTLDNGKGVCRLLNGNLCSIYQNRPLLCRVDESYKTFFKSMMSLEDYYKLNNASCEQLKTQCKT